MVPVAMDFFLAPSNCGPGPAFIILPLLLSTGCSDAKKWRQIAKPQRRDALPLGRPQPHQAYAPRSAPGTAGGPHIVVDVAPVVPKQEYEGHRSPQRRRRGTWRRKHGRKEAKRRKGHWGRSADPDPSLWTKTLPVASPAMQRRRSIRREPRRR